MRDIHCRGKSIYTDEWITGYYIGTGTLCKYGDEHYSIDDNTVGQFTGLLDKNNNRIYEDDIVVHHTIPMLVKWREDEATFVVGYNMNGQYYENVMLSHSYLEVIGNIHDNPELLG